MKTAIIVHGMPSKKSYFDAKELNSSSNEHWLPWIQHQLLLKGILAQTPEMPSPYDPDYKAWKTVFEKFVVDKNTILIGHSCGAGFIARYLSENKIKVGKVVLVAPWINIGRKIKIDMFNGLKLDPNLVARTKGVTIFSSTNDAKHIKDSVNRIKEKVKNVKIVEFKNMGHFCYNDMKTHKFPELLKEVLK